MVPGALTLSAACVLIWVSSTVGVRVVDEHVCLQPPRIVDEVAKTIDTRCRHERSCHEAVRPPCRNCPDRCDGEFSSPIDCPRETRGRTSASATGISLDRRRSRTKRLYRSLLRLQSRFRKPDSYRNDFRLAREQRNCNEFLRRQSRTGYHLSVNGSVFGFCAALRYQHKRERLTSARIADYFFRAVPIYVRPTN